MKYINKIVINCNKIHYRSYLTQTDNYPYLYLKNYLDVQSMFVLYIYGPQFSF